MSSANSDPAPVRVDYVGASWCTVCKTVGPAVAELARRHGLPLTVRDVDELPEAEAADIKKVPTVLVYRGGRCIATIVTKHAEALKATLAGLRLAPVSTDDF